MYISDGIDEDKLYRAGTMGILNGVILSMWVITLAVIMEIISIH